MSVKITAIMLIVIGLLVTVTAFILDKFEYSSTGIIVGKSSTAVAVRERSGIVRTYQLNPEKLANCDLEEVWPDCLPKL